MATQRDRSSPSSTVTVRDISRCPGDPSTSPSPGHAATPPQDALGEMTPDQREREANLPLGHPEWISPPGFSRYEASRHSLWAHGDDGKPVLTFGGIRNAAGLLMRPRVATNGYLLINLVDDTGVKRTLLVQKVILRAHAGEPGPGQEALHENDDPFDNRYPSRLYYGTHDLNERQKLGNHWRRHAEAAGTPAAPVPLFSWRRLAARVLRRSR
jgi:hypothetical protein